MNELCEITGLNWGVDREKRLNFFSRHTYIAPFSLTDTSRNFSGLKVSLTRSQYRNRQYIQAGVDTTQEIVREKPSPKPDGVSKTFLTRLPIAKKPRLFINDVEVSQDAIGVNGLDKGKRFYFSFQSNIITQDNADPVLSDTTKLEVSYFGLYPILAIAENPSEIDARKSVEGGSGIHEDVASDNTINSRQAAFDLAQGKLDKYGIIPTTITFSTYQYGLEAGQLLSITNTKHGINGSYLIESVTGRDDNGLTRYEVKCLDGSSFGGWDKLFRSMLDGGKKLTIRENEVIVMLTTMSERQNWAETNTLTIFACQVPSENLYPGEGVIPC